MFTIPGATPVTWPELQIHVVAIAVLLLLQVPPTVTSASAIAEPAQTLDGPVIGATTGRGLTLMALVTLAVPQAELTE